MKLIPAESFEMGAHSKGGEAIELYRLAFPTGEG